MVTKYIFNNSNAKGVRSSKEIKNTINSMESEGQTVVCVAINGSFTGVLALADTAREEAKSVVQHLQQMGIEVWMLSGDNKKTANAIASQLGIKNVVAKALPVDKARKIQELQNQGKVVAMVGDGINDSPALTQADVGIAVAAGTDIAIDAANIVLMKNDLNDVLTAMDLSRKVFNRIKLNFAWAFFYNILGIPLAAGVFYPLAHIYIPPPIAGLSEILSSLPVVFFSLLLYTYKPIN
jgi:Cu+-exporting ATPase